MGSPAIADATPLTPPKRPKLIRGTLKAEEQVRRRLFITAPEGLEKDDLRYPEAWGPISERLSRHDVVYVMAWDESWELECRVEAVRATGVEVSISKNITRTAVSSAENALGPDHFTQFRAGMRWCVIRRNDGHPIIKGHAIEAAAIAQFYREQPRAVV